MDKVTGAGVTCIASSTDCLPMTLSSFLHRAVPTLSRVGCALIVLAPVGVRAQTDAPATRLAPVVVTATRTDTPAFDVPASIDRIEGDAARDGRLQVNISDALGTVPGLLARDRQNYAQDVQISVRGFGARSTFGIRGVRLYVDGIPATLPDGQGQITNVDLGSVGRIEVLRGPFSALYGNSSGGVIQVFTEDPAARPTLGFGVAGGSDGALRLGTKFSATQGAFGVVASASRFTTDGYREHSAAERRIGNLKFTWAPDDDSRFTLIANHVSLPEALDPLGLTRAQFEADPRSVDPVAIAFNTRKTVEQTQGGLVYERRLDSTNSLRAMVYSGRRETEQFQAIPTGMPGPPPTIQYAPTHPGGVISLAREYHGVDLRWTYKAPLADRPFTLVGGLAYDALREHRQGYRNFVGSTLGVQGELRRDEGNEVSNLDPYLQASWQLTPRWSVNAGVRRSSVRFESNDNFVVGSNPDDSGDAKFSATLPVLGVMFAVSDTLHLYATAGRGFETPTLNELAYRPGGATGLNFALRPAESDSFEFGAKARTADLGEWRAAVFQTSTSDEIITVSNVGGRATFTNAGSTRRRGFELGWSATLAEHITAQAAFTLLDARYRDIFAGNRIPGIARSSLYLALGWTPPQGFRAGLDLRAVSRVLVNDANTDAAAGHAVIGASAGYVWRAGPWELSGFVRGDNLSDRRVIGSVIVNEGNSRFFEPAPGRTWLAGANAVLTFYAPSRGSG